MLAPMRDAESRIDAAVAMLPRVVDTVNISRGLLDWLTDNEIKAVEKKLGEPLFHFVQGNPTGHYRLQVSHLLIYQSPACFTDPSPDLSIAGMFY